VTFIHPLEVSNIPLLYLFTQRVDTGMAVLEHLLQKRNYDQTLLDL
jgi:hypothetical protein